MEPPTILQGRLGRPCTVARTSIWEQGTAVPTTALIKRSQLTLPDPVVAVFITDQLAEQQATATEFFREELAIHLAQVMSDRPGEVLPRLAKLDAQSQPGSRAFENPRLCVGLPIDPPGKKV